VTLIVQVRGADHGANRGERANSSEIVDDAVSDEADAKHGDGKNGDANQD
jgi:hypothetical protein